MTKYQLRAHACAALALAICMSAQADDAPAAATLTANATLASQYVSRGIRQTWDKPAA